MRGGGRGREREKKTKAGRQRESGKNVATIAGERNPGETHRRVDFSTTQLALVPTDSVLTSTLTHTHLVST